MTQTKPPLSVSFHNFWRGFAPTTSFFVKALGESFDVTVAATGRDVQISTVFGAQRLPEPEGQNRALRVWYTGEARDPQHQLFDLHFGFRPSSALYGKRWHRYPLWIQYIDWWNPQATTYIGRLTGARSAEPSRPTFCNFIYSAPASTRAEFLLRLNQQRPVASLGRILNNQDGKRAPGIEGKMQMLRESLFTIAFENQIVPGYVTEKLVEPLLAGSIPIYWGAAEARADFNPDAFIFAEDHGSFDDLVAHVLRVADSREALAALATAAPFHGNRPAYEHTPAFFADRIREALSGPAHATLPRALIAPVFDTAQQRSAKYRLRRLRDRLLRRRLPRQ
jgi:hypothetical protein